MSFLNNLGGAAGAAGAANGAASGLGKLIDVNPQRISSIADRIGTGMNGIAAAGGAAAGYGTPQQPAAPQQAPGVDNHLQMLDPAVLQSIIQQFGPKPATQGYGR